MGAAMHPKVYKEKSVKAIKSFLQGVKSFMKTVALIILLVALYLLYIFLTTWELTPSAPTYKSAKEVCEGVKRGGFFPGYKLVVPATKQGELTPCRFKNSIGMTYATLNVGIFDKRQMVPDHKYTIEVNDEEAHLRKFKMGNGQTLVLILDKQADLLEIITKQLGFEKKATK